MKRQHTQPENQPPLTAGDALPGRAGQPVGAAKATPFLSASTPHPTHVVTLTTPEEEVWWDEEPVTRAGGVCLLIA